MIILFKIASIIKLKKLGPGTVTSSQPILIDVKCYAGYRGEETPRVIIFQKSKIPVKKILDMWLAPDHRYFKCLGEDNAIYIIRHDTEKGFWELSFYMETDKPVQQDRD